MPLVNEKSATNSRTGAILPTPLETWENQQQQQSRNLVDNNSNNGARRILPSPKSKKDSPESEKARSVRLLLAKHQEQVNQVLQMNSKRVNNNNRPITMQQDEEETNGSGDEGSDDLQFSSAVLPGDSFPATGNQLYATSMDDVDGPLRVEDSSGEQELLKRLGQGQARMEQIKRMLVNQRGFIVEALKQLAESNSSTFDLKHQLKDQKCVSCSSSAAVAGNSGSRRPVQQDSADDEESLERDRTLGKNDMVNFGVVNGNDDAAAVISQSSTGEWRLREEENQVSNSRLCPMCEAAFPSSVSDEDFESHVVEHFSFDEAETLRYIPPEPENNGY